MNSKPPPGALCAPPAAPCGWNPDAIFFFVRRVPRRGHRRESQACLGVPFDRRDDPRRGRAGNALRRSARHTCRGATSTAGAETRGGDSKETLGKRASANLFFFGNCTFFQTTYHAYRTSADCSAYGFLFKPSRLVFSVRSKGSPVAAHHPSLLRALDAGHTKALSRWCVSRPTPTRPNTRRRARRDARVDATRGPASPCASTPRGRNAGCRVRRGVFRREAAAGPPPGTPSGCAVASRAFSPRRPRAMARRYPGRDAARPRSRAHPSATRIRVWRVFPTFPPRFSDLRPPRVSPNSRPKRPSRPRRSWARSRSRTAPSPSGSACAPVTPSVTTPSVATGAAPSSASNGCV